MEREIASLVPEDRRGEAFDRLMSVVSAEQFSGPLPHPSHLKAYEEIQPGLADRIFTMAEQDKERHHALNRMLIEADIVAERRGVTFGLFVFFTLVGTIFLAGLLVDMRLAAFLAGIGAVGIVGAFIRGRGD